MSIPFFLRLWTLLSNRVGLIFGVIMHLFGFNIYCQGEIDQPFENHDSILLLYYDSGDFQLSKTYALDILKKDSLNQVSLGVLAQIYESEQNIAKAIKYHTIRFKQDSTNAKICRKLGQLYAEAEIFREAHFYYRLANKLNDRDMLAIKGLIDIYLITENLANADSLIIVGMEIDSNNVGLLLARARVSYKMKDMNVVVTALDKAGNMTNLNNYYLRMLGYANLQIDSLEKAVYYLKAALETDRNPEFTYYYLALAHERLNEPTIAANYYEEAIEAGISKELHTYYQRLGMLMVREEKYKEAYAYLSEALTLRRDSISLYFMALTCDHRFKDKSKALTYFKELLNNPGNLDPAMLTYAKSRTQLLEEELHQKRVKP
ncbi:MAG: hypothetical protein WAT92_08720 [Saprospiraceae bacterium]|nr:hypothetical protein [Saprospiraceae bacterium]